MKKETIADKFAKKAFYSDAIQKSWQVHMLAFGPILEPAFCDNYQARIELTAALNYISNRDIKKGLEKLQSIENVCTTDADKAAWLFCMGLCMEMANIKDDMIYYYQESGKYGHKFYLPYLKIAKMAHNDAVFEMAEEYYNKSIFCLNEGEMGAQRSIILSSVYTNYASCLTMMHRYEEAEDALRLSCEVLPEQKGRDTVIAILMAAKGDSEGAYNILNVIETQLPDIYNTTKKMVDDILDKKHPHFNAVAVPEERITSFWDWFVSNEVNLLQCLENKDYDTVFNLIQDELKKLFPFVERNLELGIEPKSDCYQIIFADFFMVSLKIAYRKLIDAVPQSLKKRWAFDIAR